MGHFRSTVAVFTFTLSRMPEGRKVSGDTALFYSFSLSLLFLSSTQKWQCTDTFFSEGKEIK